MKNLVPSLAVGMLWSCSTPATDASPEASPTPTVPEAQYTLTADQVHSKFSRTIPPVLTVPSGSVIEAYTQEATAGQITPNSTVADLATLSFDPIHPLTGPVYVEGAEPGDVLAVTLHEVELDTWGWSAILPGFGYLADTFTEPYLKIYEINKEAKTAQFAEGHSIALTPFPGVMAVAPDTDSLLNTIPPRANGGNMDDPNMTAGTTVYFPVWVKGALFSIGDGHATQGHGEVCGTAIEAPLRFVYEVNVIKGHRKLEEPEYETQDYYATTAYATTLDEAARRATLNLVNYLVAEKGMERNDAYVLCSIAGDLKIAEVVDVPHVLVTMHMDKETMP
ncbi:MAG: acetamidase/formamidase family protein [Bacteroidota bacterium]